MKIHVLRIYDADDNSEWGVHTSINSVNEQLYAYAAERWDGYEDLPPIHELSPEEAFLRFFAAAEDYQWYEIRALPLQGEVDLPDDTALLTSRELVLTQIALHNTTLPTFQQGLAQANEKQNPHLGQEILELSKKLEL